MLHIKLVKKIKTRILRSILFFPFENRAVYDVWKHTVHPYSLQIAIMRMRTACWIPKVTNKQTHTHTHSEYVIIIIFPLQQGLRERASMLRDKRIACLVITTDNSVTSDCIS